MLKKTLWLFFVLALVAQICARPEDKDDAAKASQEAADEASKEGIDKVRDAGKKGQAEAKRYADKGRENADDLQKKSKAAVGGHNAERNKHLGHQLSAVIREAEKTGEKLIESGTNTFADFIDQMGF